MYTRDNLPVANRITPIGANYPGAPEREPIFDGTYYQPADPETCQRRLEVALAFAGIKGEGGQLPISAYQDWVELDWLKPHGSHDAAERFYKKVAEEGKESLDELDDVPEPWPDRADFDNTKAVDELGDWLWTTVASASNGGIHVERAVAGHMYEQGLRLSRSRELPLAELDEIIAAGHIPYVGIMDVDPTDPNTHVDEMHPHPNIMLHAARIAITGVRQFGYGDTPTPLSTFREVGEQLMAPAIAETVLLLAYYASIWANSSLSEVAAHNITKIHNRAIHNQIEA